MYKSLGIKESDITLSFSIPWLLFFSCRTERRSVFTILEADKLASIIYFPSRLEAIIFPSI